MIFSAKRAICLFSRQAQANLDHFFTTLLPLWKLSQLFFTAARDLEMLDLVSINEDHGPQIPCSPFANYVRLELKSASILGLVENRPTLHALSFLAITILYRLIYHICVIQRLQK